MTVVSDGKTLSIAVDMMQKYSEGPAPASFAELMADPIVQSVAFQASVFGNFLTPDPYKELMDGVTEAKYAGLVTLEDVKVHHLKFTQDQFDWEIWVSAEGDPMLRKGVTDLTKAFAKLPGGEQLKNQKLEIVEEYKDWRIDQKIDDATFTFKAPKGHQKVDSLIGDAGGEEPPSPLLGEEAPNVNLKLLEKGEFQLKEHRGEHIVMLDFWATWCGPCMEELPEVQKMIEAYGQQKKDVVIVALSQDQRPSELGEVRKLVEKTLEDKKITLTGNPVGKIAVDPSGTVGEAFRIEGYPTVVILDAKGVVQAAHVGFRPGVRESLSRDIDALLEGKSLLKPKKANE